MGCVYCELRDGQRGIKKVYKDESTFAVLHPNPAVPGHVVVMPKEHVTILEQLSDFEVEQLFTTTNALSKLLFEALPIQGTNIIIQNGSTAGQEIPHVAVHLIPRFEGDGLSFEWDPKKYSDQEMSTVEVLFRELAKQLTFDHGTKKEVRLEPKKEVLKEEPGAENVMLRHLNRIP